jgi:hypothetical protein
MLKITFTVSDGHSESVTSKSLENIKKTRQELRVDDRNT